MDKFYEERGAVTMTPHTVVRLVRYVPPLTLAAALVAVGVYSEVRPLGPALPVVVLELALWVYVAVLAVLAVKPMWLFGHAVGIGLAVVVIGTRILGFLDLVLGGASNLWGAVFERVPLLAIAALWHLTSVTKIAQTGGE